ncbi:hypothetical protein [Nocardia beijingensis]|uniref:hypothetical protein n=1 Tax=Nocardia beijingensis TaxID=95162 RepID=UPI001895ADCB|nr:hypothetical protein [Nocardia beijingensis]MBF6077949.1 hypothetical protein [Nocardia beijingensis]
MEDETQKIHPLVQLIKVMHRRRRDQTRALPTLHRMERILTAGVVVVALALLAVGTFYVLPYLLDRDDPLPESAIPVIDILDRLDIEHAHATMQNHVRCSIDSCPDKADAYWTLVKAGHIVPDERAQRRWQ